MLAIELVRLLQAHDLLDMDDADNDVEGIVIHRQASVIARRELLGEQFGLRRQVERLNVIARGHHIVDTDRVEVEQMRERRPMRAWEVVALENNAAGVRRRKYGF